MDDGPHQMDNELFSQSVRLTRVHLQGEVDIVEGVNDETPNASSLHTGSGNVSPLL
jgi:hypothetical protein